MWSARCVETRTPGAAGGLGKRTGRKAGTAPRSDRDVEELLAERGIEVDHTTLFRRVAQFTPLFTEWRSLYRAIDRFGQVIDVLVARKRDKTAARRFLTRALAGVTSPTEVTTDRAPAYPRVVEDMLPGALHVTVKYANNRVEADHGRLKARLRPMRGMKRTDRCGSSPPGTRSSRTCAADTTNSPPTPPPVIEWRSRSPSSPSRSEQPGKSAASGRPRAANATVRSHPQARASSRTTRDEGHGGKRRLPRTPRGPARSHIAPSLGTRIHTSASHPKIPHCDQATRRPR